MTSLEQVARDPWVRYGAALAFVALVIAAVMFFAQPRQYSFGGQRDYKAAEKLFSEEIRKYGGKQAYERMAVAINNMLVDEQHGYAHSFGKALYEVKGEKGISVCDTRFNLGCFHQFLGDAIGDLGQDAIKRLYDECGDVIGSIDMCQHGLGHGILSSVGYTEPDLVHALALCADVTKEKTYAGCYGGVFMEYNVRTIAEAEGSMSSRQPEDGNLYAPCDRMSGDDRSVCVFWLPQWWFFSVFHGQDNPVKKNQIYRDMGDLCTRSGAAQSCYEGIGYITPPAQWYDADLSRALCDQAGEPGALYCRSMAALIFHITAYQQEKAPRMCEGYAGHARDVCTRYATHDGDFSFSVKE